jgi:hypothetical protein
MPSSVSFICSKCSQLVKPEQAKELVSEPGADRYQYDHKGTCPFDRATELNKSVIASKLQKVRS